MANIKRQFGYIGQGLVLTGLILIAACSNPPAGGPIPPKLKTTFRLTFGSCSKIDLPQPLWSAILSSQPDLWIWLGDIIYADTEDREVMQRMYGVQKSHPGYRELSEKCRIIGTWDDHDFGINDGGADYPMKAQSQELLLDFLDEPKDSPRRRQEGVYTAYRFQQDALKIKIILLDERYFREEARAGKDILGKKQWDWLEKEMLADTADVTIIGSSTQVIPSDNWAFNEVWSDYPQARKRLLDLMDSVPGKAVIISGDQHFAEITKSAGQSLYEFTSSGMTHHKNQTWLNISYTQPNRQRVGDRFCDLNFGVIDIDTESRALHVFLCDRDGQIRLSQTIRL